MPSLYDVLRWYLGLYNVILFCIALIPLGSAIYWGLKADNLASEIAAIAIFCMANIILGISFAGSCGALLQSAELLLVNAYVTSVVSILTARIYVMLYTPAQLHNAKQLLVDWVFMNHVIDELEYSYQCCGRHNPFEYYQNGAPFPKECCTYDGAHLFCSLEGCETVVSRYISFVFDILRGVSCYVSLGGVLAVVCALCIANDANVTINKLDGEAENVEKDNMTMKRLTISS